MARIRGYIITLVAFVWLFSTVRFQMFPQIACQGGFIVTLVAFVLLFSTMRFQMFPQIACQGGWDKKNYKYEVWLLTIAIGEILPEI